MKHVLSVSILACVMIVLSACATGTEDDLGSTSQALTGWHDLSQSARNQAIVDETAYWDDGDWGDQCKVWVQTIVNDASGISGLIPTNNGTCYWNYGSYVVGRSAYIHTALPGEIIQMTLNGGGPHTAIVIANGPSSITFRESNWCSGNCELVGTRTVSHSTFYSQVSCYTIYYVL